MLASLLAIALATTGHQGLLAIVNKGADSVRFTDIRTGQMKFELPSAPHPQEVAFVDAGRLAVISNMGTGPQQRGRTLTVVDIKGQSVARTIDLGEHAMPHGVVPLDSRRVLVTSHATDHLIVVNVVEGKVERSMPSGGKGTHLAVLSPDRKVAYAANVGSGTVTAVEIETGKVLASIPAGARAEGISISPDGKRIAIGNVGANSVTLIDAEKPQVVRTIENLPTPIRTLFSSDGKRIFVSCAGLGALVAFDWEGKETGRLDLKKEAGFKLWAESHPIPMNLDRRGGLIYSVILNANEVIAFDEKSMKMVGRWATGQLPDGMAIG